MNSQRCHITFLLALFLFCAGVAKAAEAVGQMPVPTLKDVQVVSSVTYDSATKLYTYSYTVSNGAASTGAIFGLDVDMASPGTDTFSSDLVASLIFNVSEFEDIKNPTFNEQKKSLEPLKLPPSDFLVPFGLSVPHGWTGDLTVDGYASFGSGSDSDNVQPGGTLSGFQLISPGAPTIREMVVEPWWVPVFDSEPDETELQSAGSTQQDIRLHIQTLAPAGSIYLIWGELEKALAQTVQLGWVSDATLAQQIKGQLDAANNAAIQEHDGTKAKTLLQSLLATLTAAPATAMNEAARDLITLDTQALIAHTPDTPIPVTPTYSLAPAESLHAVGETATLVATVVNSSDHNKPIAGAEVRFSIMSGPNQKPLPPTNSLTDSNGQVSFSYQGVGGTGTDKVVLSKPIFYIVQPQNPAPAPEDQETLPPGTLAAALVHWQGGADLAVPFFMPPMIQGEPGHPIDLTDETQNQGNLPADASVTRFYLLKHQTDDIAGAPVLASRNVPPLAAGETSHSTGFWGTLPSDLTPGIYYLVACADAENKVAETNEKNNCSNSQLENTLSITVPVLHVTNQPPNCDHMQPSEYLLWPPNHKLHTISVTGVTDPDGDAVTLVVTGIEQDEPVNGKGDGNTAPDGFGVGSAQTSVRAERSGGGSGRLYFIHVSASDGKGGTCKGIVTVGVPHDQSSHGLPVDTGERYDSTQG
jgi:hypothetical protein